MTGFSPHLLLLLLLLPCWQEAAAAAGTHEPAVSVERQGDYFRVEVSVILPVPRCQAYALLTDYASLPSFIPGILEVSFTRMANSKVRIRQVGETELLFFDIRMELLLEMDEIPDRRIMFKLVKGDMEAYSGVWNLLEATEGTGLHYSATLKFDRYIPTFPGRELLADEAQKRFEALVREAAARKNRAHPNCTVAK